jgi:GH25 family lysozyme M1 (1,4-beta-N-acetylmuramidase)
MTGMLRGFDISAYQGSEDLPGFVQAYSLDFVVCRAWQSNSQRDTKFPDYWRQLGALDVVRGAYCFANSGTSATASADRFVDYVLEQGPLHPTDLLVLDLESNLGNLSANALAAWGLAWAARVVERCPDHKPVYYGGYPVHPQYRGFAEAFSAWWFARYPTVYSTRAVWPKQFITTVPATYWPGGPTIWQFSQDFPIGPNDPHDANISTLTVDQLRSLNPGAQDMPLTQQEKDDIIHGAAREVWNATFGETDGADVAVMLQRAYHNSATALARVDALVAKVEALTVALGQGGGVITQPAGIALADVEAAIANVVSRTTISTSSTLTAP